MFLQQIKHFVRHFRLTVLVNFSALRIHPRNECIKGNSEHRGVHFGRYSALEPEVCKIFLEVILLLQVNMQLLYILLFLLEQLLHFLEDHFDLNLFIDSMKPRRLHVELVSV